jgi:isopenicillin-N epimerase
LKIMDRRSFFASAATTLAAFQLESTAKAQKAAARVAGRPAETVAQDEDFWFNIREAFTVDRTLINLNNGGVSPAPRIVQDTEIRYLEMQNMNPTYYMWRILDPGVETCRRRLAKSFGCDPEEIAITRNASEALEIVQFGLDLKAGDEVITTNQDYPRMITSWQQRERRDGIVLKQLKFTVPPPSLDYLARLIEDAITPKTKVIHICHITNRTGQIFPVKEICRMGRARGIEVIVDGAHAYAQFPFKHADLDCDYYGVSLHKWLLAPIGTGMLYMRKAKIPKIWPMMGADESLVNDIRKFEQIGTHPASQRNAIAEALNFHESIGVERKAARFRYLRARWSDPLRKFENVQLLTSDDPAQSCGIGLVGIKGIESAKLVGWLWSKYRIWVTAFVSPGEYEGIRVTPNVYTTLEEIDTFVEAMTEVAKRGSLPV